jgi:hypothetical protein
MDTLGFIPRGKMAGLAADQLTPSSAKVKDAYIFMA